MTIPTYLEQLIHQGKAEAKVFTGGLSAQTEIYCPTGSYLVIYGYYYKPYNPSYGQLYDIGTTPQTLPTLNFRDAIQYVGFGYDGKFSTFVHSIDLSVEVSGGGAFVSENPGAGAQQRRNLNDIAVQERSCYLVSSTNVGVSISRLNGNNLVFLAAGILPQTVSILRNLGYGGLLSELTMSDYIDNTGAIQYMNVTPETFSSITPLAPGLNFTNQLYTNPVLGGELADPQFYVALVNSAAGKAAMPVLNVLYVQVNEQKPINTI